MNGTRKGTPAPSTRQAKVLLTPADQKALAAIIAAGWATNTTTGIRIALRIASERIASGAAA